MVSCSKSSPLSASTEDDDSITTSAMLDLDSNTSDTLVATTFSFAMVAPMDVHVPKGSLSLPTVAALVLAQMHVVSPLAANPKAAANTERDAAVVVFVDAHHTDLTKTLIAACITHILQVKEEHLGAQRVFDKIPNKRAEAECKVKLHSVFKWVRMRHRPMQ